VRGKKEVDAAVDGLLDALGIDPESYQDFVAWALAEQLVLTLTDAVRNDPDHQLKPLWDRPDGGKRFRHIARTMTGRSWSNEDEQRLFDRVHLALVEHDRQPIPAEDLLRLLWNTPHVCVRCDRKPPEIKLHVDHIFPVSRGGTSRFPNLQLLCAECNLRKSNKLEQEGLWLSSV
jgi:5-methylcytosine-specific restriction endonuclease McrA